MLPVSNSSTPSAWHGHAARVYPFYFNSTPKLIPHGSIARVLPSPSIPRWPRSTMRTPCQRPTSEPSPARNAGARWLPDAPASGPEPRPLSSPMKWATEAPRSASRRRRAPESSRSFHPTSRPIASDTQHQLPTSNVHPPTSIVQLPTSIADVRHPNSLRASRRSVPSRGAAPVESEGRKPLDAPTSIASPAGAPRSPALAQPPPAPRGNPAHPRPPHPPALTRLTAPPPRRSPDPQALPACSSISRTPSPLPPRCTRAPAARLGLSRRT